MNKGVYEATLQRIDKRCLTELGWTFYDAHWVGHGEAAMNISIDEFVRVVA